MWRDWVVGILGIWLVILAYIGRGDSTHTTLLVITGIIVAIIGFWNALGERV